MQPGFVDVDGVRIAYHVQGDGPPLVLVMGYRLSSAAWPSAFIEMMSSRFTVITIDNRGTGLSDKPVKGYAIANMARDVRAVLDELELRRVHLLGYSMGGAIAQEFVRQFPERVASLILCATMCGGSRARYASGRVAAIMRNLDGLSPEQAARRIWTVTYAPGYLERHRNLAEQQMQREIAHPTPLHAADLQFQAFAEFDGSAALANIGCPTLVITGDLDELIPPENSELLARSVPGAQLAILGSRGHRVLWEETLRCAELIADFIESPGGPGAVIEDDVIALKRRGSQGAAPLPSLFAYMATWPLSLLQAGAESMSQLQQSVLVRSGSRFGDGKPVILVPQALGDVMMLQLSLWLSAVGYRVARAAPAWAEESLANTIFDMTERIGRKGVLITHDFGLWPAVPKAEVSRERISDVVLIGSSARSDLEGVRVHSVPAWPLFHMLMELLGLLRRIELELIGEASPQRELKGQALTAALP